MFFLIIIMEKERIESFKNQKTPLSILAPSALN